MFLWEENRPFFDVKTLQIFPGVEIELDPILLGQTSLQEGAFPKPAFDRSLVVQATLHERMLAAPPQRRCFPTLVEILDWARASQRLESHRSPFLLRTK